MKHIPVLAVGLTLRIEQEDKYSYFAQETSRPGRKSDIVNGCFNVIKVVMGQCKLLWITSVFHVMQFLLIRTRIKTKIKYAMLHIMAMTLQMNF